ncbi:MAG: hypothetical protein ACPGUD_05845 [Parashewanella sp.]
MAGPLSIDGMSSTVLHSSAIWDGETLTNFETDDLIQSLKNYDLVKLHLTTKTSSESTESKKQVFHVQLQKEANKQFAEFHKKGIHDSLCQFASSKAVAGLLKSFDMKKVQQYFTEDSILAAMAAQTNLKLSENDMLTGTNTFLLHSMGQP